MTELEILELKLKKAQSEYTVLEAKYKSLEETQLIDAQLKTREIEEAVEARTKSIKDIAVKEAFVKLLDPSNLLEIEQNIRRLGIKEVTPEVAKAFSCMASLIWRGFEDGKPRRVIPPFLTMEHVSESVQEIKDFVLANEPLELTRENNKMLKMLLQQQQQDKQQVWTGAL